MCVCVQCHGLRRSVSSVFDCSSFSFSPVPRLAHLLRPRAVGERCGSSPTTKALSLSPISRCSPFVYLWRWPCAGDSAHTLHHHAHEHTLQRLASNLYIRLSKKEHPKPACCKVRPTKKNSSFLFFFFFLFSKHQMRARPNARHPPSGETYCCVLYVHIMKLKTHECF